MKKRSRIHHQAANRIRQLFAKKEPLSREADESTDRIATQGSDQSTQQPNQPPIQSNHGGNGQENSESARQDRGPNSYEEAQLNLTRKLVGATVIIALATVVYMGFSGYQSWQMRKQVNAFQTSIKQTNQSLGYAQRQTEASERSVSSSTNTSQRIVEQNERAVKAAETQANTSKTTANSAEESLRTARRSMIVGSRAYIGVNTIETDLKRGQVTFWLENIGKVPATNIKVLAGTALPQTTPSGEPEGFRAPFDEILDLGIAELFPGPFRLPVVIWIRDFTPETEPIILSRQRVLHVSCMISYDNGFEGRSESLFIFYYLPPPDDKWIPRGQER